MGMVFSQYQECQIQKVFILILQQNIWWTVTVEAKKNHHKDNIRGETEEQTHGKKKQEKTEKTKCSHDSKEGLQHHLHCPSATTPRRNARRLLNVFTVDVDSTRRPC